MSSTNSSAKTIQIVEKFGHYSIGHYLRKKIIRCGINFTFKVAH
jgi:hypothetical protein